MSYGKEIVLILGSYALGCFTTGYYLVCLLTGKDVRSLGSGNVGTRNVGRVIGKPGLVVTFLGGAGKGAAVFLAASYFGLEPWAMMLAIIAVVAGHIWPVQLSLRGGKGVATSLGALTVLDWQLVAIIVGITALAFALVRRFTPSGLIAFLLAPVASYAVGQQLTVVLGVSALAILVLVAHRTDIRLILRLTRERTGKSEIKLPD